MLLVRSANLPFDVSGKMLAGQVTKGNESQFPSEGFSTHYTIKMLDQVISHLRYDEEGTLTLRLGWIRRFRRVVAYWCPLQ